MNIVRSIRVSIYSIRLAIKLMTERKVVTLASHCPCGCEQWLVGIEGTYWLVSKKSYDRIKDARDLRGLPTEVIL